MHTHTHTHTRQYYCSSVKPLPLCSLLSQDWHRTISRHSFSILDSLLYNQSIEWRDVYLLPPTVFACLSWLYNIPNVNKISWSHLKSAIYVLRVDTPSCSLPPTQFPWHFRREQPVNCLLYETSILPVMPPRPLCSIFTGPQASGLRQATGIFHVMWPRQFTRHVNGIFKSISNTAISFWAQVADFIYLGDNYNAKRAEILPYMNKGLPLKMLWHNIWITDLRS